MPDTVSDVVATASALVTERLCSLQKDVEHCLAPPYAPFPAMLYCFATVDLLGALHGGDATRRANSSAQSKAYMNRFMRYTDEQADLLQRIFRHKMVHLAQPSAVIRHGGRLISWRYVHRCREDHLTLIALPPGSRAGILRGQWTACDHLFSVSIWHFMSDIRASADGPAGYLATVAADTGAQIRFSKALASVLDPTQ